MNTGEIFNSLSKNLDDFVIESSVYPTINVANPIEKGDYAEYVFSGYFPSSGEKSLSFVVDGGDTIDETNEDNNSRSSSVTVYEWSEADISISKLDVSIEKPLINEELEIEVNVKNSGKISFVDDRGFMFYNSVTTPSVERDIYYILPDFKVSDISFENEISFDNPLDPGEVTKIYFTGMFTKAGEKELAYLINVNDRLEESDYENNIASTSIKIYNSISDRDAFEFLNVRYENISSSSVKFLWETDEKITCTFLYRQSIFSTFEVITSSSKTEHSITLSDLEPGALYYYKIQASLGESEKETSLDSFKTLSSNEISISDEGARVVNSKILANFTSNIYTKARLYYRVKGESNFSSIAESDYGINHSLETQTLESANYEYYLYLESKAGTEYETKVNTIAVGTPSNQADVKEIVEEAIENTNDEQVSESQNETLQEINISNDSLYNNLKGKIILRVENNGEAYYIDPSEKKMYFLGRPDDAFNVMRKKGIGVSNTNLEKIKVSLLIENEKTDTDNDGLDDEMEDAIGTNKNLKDSDGDDFDDRSELDSGYNPVVSGGTRLPINEEFSEKNQGKIFLAVERNGEAWYVSPNDKMRYFLGRPADAFSVMRELGLGVSENNFESLK
ncbi:hypothetical protein C0583_03290 [Candidatus Parcubacteria bacterium]|nr:MAG: hypothetical protein C0583_03290 [Candidatus Parcubacteria bacterium]